MWILRELGAVRGKELLAVEGVRWVPRRWTVVWCCDVRGDVRGDVRAVAEEEGLAAIRRLRAVYAGACRRGSPGTWCADLGGGAPFAERAGQVTIDRSRGPTRCFQAPRYRNRNKNSSSNSHSHNNSEEDVVRQNAHNKESQDENNQSNKRRGVEVLL